ncbi:hypothetical protein, partial [Escherichia coli]|uniref:hypothetical protein n=1 Tax=Escherichia coli TaxID=562 RepID=UPI00254CC338
LATAAGCGVNALSDLRLCSVCRPDKTPSVASGNGTALIVGCGATALFDLHTTHFPAKFAPHISLSINGFVTETIVFFYICLNLFLRYLWLTLAFSAVRFSVHGINRSDIHLFLRFFSLNA